MRPKALIQPSLFPSFSSHWANSFPSALPSVTTEYLKPIRMKTVEWISDLPQWEWLSLTDQIKGEEWMLWMWSHGLVHFSIYPFIFNLSIHSSIFFSGALHFHWHQEGFVSGNLLKAALGEIFMGKYTSSLNHKQHIILTNWRFNPFYQLQCLCLVGRLPGSQTFQLTRKNQICSSLEWASPQSEC